MAISSMTGFARAAGHDAAQSWTWEIKSVNGRNLDVRCRLPLGFDRLEVTARALIAERFKRGSITASLALNRTAGVGNYRINRELIDRLAALQDEYVGRVAPERPRLDTLLTVRGVVEPSEEAEGEEAAERRIEAMAAALAQALESLAEARRAEGGKLATLLAGHIDTIERLTADAGATAALRPEAIKARLREQVAALREADPPLPEERLAQEAALLAAKADAREELDRLLAHVGAARELIARGGAVGRRLDFLCQEFNREANTLCAKSADVALTRIGLELKAAVEQLREQVQNVE